jgi:subtilisin family serine protease
MHISKSVLSPRDKNITVPSFPDGKEYIVSLKAGVDYNAFWTEIETNGSGSTYVPSRGVRIINERTASLRSCHYALSDAEAELLRKDDRVDSVVLPIQSLGFKPHPRVTQIGNFDKPADVYTSTGNKINWGLVRNNSNTNNYGTVLTAPNGYDYTLDGTGVDIVIMDTGLQIDHPEVTDSVQIIDWYAESGVSGSMPENHYQDTIGHGTHVAGIAAGKTFGWAKGAAIYSVKLQGLEGSEGGALPYMDAFDVIIGWHNNKPTDPVTGLKRPTIVNMSWGFSGAYYYDDTHTNVMGGSYRGTIWSGSGTAEDVHAEYGMGEFGTYPVRDPATDSIIEEMIDAGIHICIAAGNDGIKIDVPGGADYNNYFVDDMGYFNFYNQGGSPYSSRAMIVGALDNIVYDEFLDRKVDFSQGGPGVDLYAAGTAIYSSTSNTNVFADEGYTDAPYFLNSDYKQANISGTSMASPQMTGLGALILQVNPGGKPTEFKNWVLYNLFDVSNAILNTEMDNDYTNLNSLWGGIPNVMFNKFNSPVSLTLRTVVELDVMCSFPQLPKYHWKPDPVDGVYPIYTMDAIPTLPASVDMRNYASPVDDQGDLGSCTGNAIAGAIDLLDNKNGKALRVSRLFIYYQERLIENDVKYDAGAYIHDGIKACTTYGAPLETLWPYNVKQFAVKPSATAYSDALNRKMTGSSKAANFTAVKNALAAGYPVVVGFLVYSSFENIGSNGIMPYPNVNTEQLLGGHAVCLVGYNDATQTFIARNSWGSAWGDHGYFYMPYQVIQNTNMSSDFWVISSVHNP